MLPAAGGVVDNEKEMSKSSTQLPVAVGGVEVERVFESRLDGEQILLSRPSHAISGDAGSFRGLATSVVLHVE